MHVYEYQCKQCGHKFEHSSHTLEEHEKEPKPKCPKCQSKNVEQRPASFQAVTSTKT